MKKLLVIYGLIATFAFGFASPSFAQHCTVQHGDSMWRIAKQYNIPFHIILDMNKHFKNQHLIHPGDKIEMPDSHGTGSQTSEHSASDNIAEGNETTQQAGTSDQAEAVLKLVNEERAKQGLKQLTLSSKLTSIANTKAKDMAVNNYFSHTSPTYGTPFQMLQQFGVSYKSAGENIAAGQPDAPTVMKAWMNSSGHRANILNSSYTELGVGYYAGGNQGHFWVQLFTGK